jgi:ATP-dependent helicase/nuclease subunit B
MAAGPSLYFVPAERSFADAVAQRLIAENAGLALARTLLLVPSRRARRALADAFVRASGGALLLPRLVVIGDIDEDLALSGVAGADQLAAEARIPPVIDGFERRMLLLQLVRRWQDARGAPAPLVESMRLADALARTLDQLQIEEVDPAAVEGLDLGGMGTHWQTTLDFLALVTRQWPQLLLQLRRSDRMARRQLLLRRLAAQWRTTPPATPVLAVGMATADPATAALLGIVARLPNGRVVLPGLEPDNPDWAALDRNPSHPQAALKRLVDGMDMAVAEARVWPHSSGEDGPHGRARGLSVALAAAARTGDWPPAIDLAGLAVVEARAPAEEATAIAIAMRRQLEQPGRTAALVTPDRQLARRVAAQLGRWGIAVDDSAGRPLSMTPPGLMLLLALQVAKSRFAPVELLALLKHPLAGPDDAAARLGWLDNVRRLDLLLRGVRPPKGLTGVSARIAAAAPTLAAADRTTIQAWWHDVQQQLAPVAALAEAPAPLDVAADMLRDFADRFSGPRFWSGEAGRATSALIDDLIAHGGSSGPVPPDQLAAAITVLFDSVAVRPPYGGHPRLAILGLLEARLQRADLVILGGLNEGVWPASGGFDPWLPPALRRTLGLPEEERAIGLAAHDFLMAAAAPDVLLTRAKRDASAPTVPSRFWLRLAAYAGDGLRRADDLLALAEAIDRRPPVPRAARPAPSPPPAARPRRISVTAVDRLAADPFSFYAERVLRLPVLERLDIDLSAAARGTLVHEVLESLIASGRLGDAKARQAALDAALATHADQPLVGALWAPRAARMLDWVAGEMADRASQGWQRMRSEVAGSFDVAGVRLVGKADVVVEVAQTAAAGLALIDFKTGQMPNGQKIRDRHALQLGLLGWLAREGQLDGVAPALVDELAYWKLTGGAGKRGEIKSTKANYPDAWQDVAAFIDDCRDRFLALAARYLTGDAPFIAKAHAEYAQHLTDYDQLARVAEWQGRRTDAEGAA